MSKSVDFDQTAHIQKQSDLCLHPFLRLSIHSAYSLIFDVKCKRPESTLHFSRHKKSHGQCDVDLQFPHQSGKEINSVDPGQTAPMRFNQGLHYLQISATSASFACNS